MQIGKQQREGVDLVPCTGCKGNVRLKVPMEVIGGKQTIGPITPPPGVLPGSLGPFNPVNPSWFTAVYQISYAKQGKPPKGFDYGFTRGVASSEQHYYRELQIDVQWRKLDTGWLTTASLVVVENEGAGQFGTYPTPEEQEERGQRIIELAYCCPFATEPAQKVVTLQPCSPGHVWVVRPGHCLPVEPANLSDLIIRCRNGIANCVVVVIPR